MSNEPKSTVRRISIEYAQILDVIEKDKKWTKTTTLNEVVKASPLFKSYCNGY